MAHLQCDGVHKFAVVVAEVNAVEAHEPVGRGNHAGDQGDLPREGRRLLSGAKDMAALH